MALSMKQQMASTLRQPASRAAGMRRAPPSRATRGTAVVVRAAAAPPADFELMREGVKAAAPESVLTPRL